MGHSINCSNQGPSPTPRRVEPDYRLGQAHFASWLAQMGPERADEVRRLAVEVVRPIMRPYRPIVVFLAALIPKH